MLTEEQLRSMLSDLESDRVERTVSVSNTDKFGQAICAFANDFPNHQKAGYLIIGASDDGRPSGLTVTDDLLQNLAALRSDGNIQPLPAITVSKHALAEGDLAVVEVLPSDLPPVRCHRRGHPRSGVHEPLRPGSVAGAEGAGAQPEPASPVYL